MRPKRHPVLYLLLVLAVVGLAQSPAEAGRHDDPRQRREEVRQRRAAVADQVDALRAEDARVQAALDALRINLSTQEALLMDAQSGARRAIQELEAAQTAEAQALASIADLQARYRRLAVDAYIGRGLSEVRSVFGAASDLGEAARSLELVDVVFDSAADLGDRLRAAQEDVALARAAAERASAAASTREAEVSARVVQVREARDQHMAFAGDVAGRIEARLAEAAGLAALDQELSAEMIRRQQLLEAKNRAALAEAARLRRPSASAASAAAAPTNSELRSVRGIQVHSSIAENLERLFAAADADGVGLAGGGYRNRSQQQSLREANCPDPQNSPAAACSPPTARPGYSMHERGLAVDFTFQGRLIRSRSSAAFRWLAKNASRFSLYNLPSEPWHWSSNGQ